MDAHDIDPRGSLTPGQLFSQEYRVERVIAAGGMGTVYEVTQRSLGVPRALKVLHHWLADDDRVRRRFVEEARISTRIESEHVAQVIDAGVAMPGSVPWYVMELLRGETLESLVARRGLLPPEEVLAILDPVCHAAGAAHRIGVVHCDLKPENIMVAEARRADARLDVKVLDFGIAHVVPALKTYVKLTRAQGSPGWLAPEQLHVEGKVSAASDVWALGLIAFDALTGGSYWRHYGQYPAILAEMEVAPIEAASARVSSLGRAVTLPAGFDDWFARCVDRDPARRFADASVAMEALRVALAPSPAVVDDDRAVPGRFLRDPRAERVEMLCLALNEAERRGEVEARIGIGEELLGGVGLVHDEIAPTLAAHEIAPHTAAAHVARAWSREQAGDRAGALDDGRRAVALAPGSAAAHYLVGVLQLRRLDFTASLVALDRAVALLPDAAGFLRERARCLHALGQYDRALADRTEVLRLDPERAEAWTARALVHLARRDARGGGGRPHGGAAAGARGDGRAAPAGDAAGGAGRPRGRARRPRRGAGARGRRRGGVVRTGAGAAGAGRRDGRGGVAAPRGASAATRSRRWAAGARARVEGAGTRAADAVGSRHGRRTTSQRSPSSGTRQQPCDCPRTRRGPSPRARSPRRRAGVSATRTRPRHGGEGARLDAWGGAVPVDRLKLSEGFFRTAKHLDAKDRARPTRWRWPSRTITRPSRGLMTSGWTRRRPGPSGRGASRGRRFGCCTASTSTSSTCAL